MDNQAFPNDYYNVPLKQQPPHTGERFVNYLIDLILFYIVFIGLNILIGVLAAFNGKESLAVTGNSMDKVINYVFAYCVYVLYYLFSEGASNGRSLGKLCTHTKAVKLNGDPITWEDALMRSLCRLIPFEPLSAFIGDLWHET